MKNHTYIDTISYIARADYEEDYREFLDVNKMKEGEYSFDDWARHFSDVCVDDFLEELKMSRYSNVFVAVQPSIYESDKPIQVNVETLVDAVTKCIGKSKRIIVEGTRHGLKITIATGSERKENLIRFLNDKATERVQSGLQVSNDDRWFNSRKVEYLFTD